MNIGIVILAAAVVGVIGLVIGLLLGFAAERFQVEVDERELAVRELLPGNNCGGCGFAGCDGLAKAIAAGEVPATACPVASAEATAQISALMGVSAQDRIKEVAFVKCAGTCEVAKDKYDYYGVADCKTAMMTPGQGAKACGYGCLGLGSCVRACPFGAIHIVDGVATVIKEKCVACGKCIRNCPKHLIEIIPYESKYLVTCNSHNKGKQVKEVCSVGCIGCGLCVRVCEDDAISVDNHLAYIDQAKCTGCGKCEQKCPVKIISKA